jgi:homogentisate 1,2-dioxygenase
MPHGPDNASYEKGEAAELEPQRLRETMAVLFESRYVFKPTAQALALPSLQKNYDNVWSGFKGNFSARQQG